MSTRKEVLTNILDKAIVVFIIIFLLTLSNSIFLNQLGYYGALLLFLIRWSVTKENPFSKSGLEFAFIWFILAEIISTILSADQSHAFNNLLKRILLLPIVYVMIASVKETNRGKLYFNIYIGATIVTVLIYLYFAVQHFVDDLYGITQSGPSIFQYPITASEIISFTVIFLFAFMINEKSGIKMKLLFGAGFLLSLAALFSTYKRTGWLGAAFGILIILIVKKQYKLLLAGFILLVIAFILEKDISRVNVYSFGDSELRLQKVIETDGKAHDVYFDDGLILSDYQEGLFLINNSVPQKLMDTPSPVVSFKNWTEKYSIAHLSDTRFIVFEKAENEYRIGREFVPPGYTVGYEVSDDILFVLDSDSGVTVYLDPQNTDDFIRYPQFAKFTRINVDKDFICLASADSGFRIYQHSNGILEKNTFISDTEKLNYVLYDNNRIYVENRNGLQVFEIDSSSIVLLKEFKSLNGIISSAATEDKIAFISAGGNITFISKDITPVFIKDFSLGFTPNSVILINDKLITTYVKPSRLLSIFDPYNRTNLTRFALWSAGIKIWKDHPVFGVGDIDLAGYYKQYKHPYDKEILGHMHNNFVHVLITLGLFGLLAVLFIFYKIIAIDLKIIKETKNIPFVSSYAVGALGAFCGFLFSGLTELNFWDHEITTLIWFTFGLNVALFKSVKPGSQSSIKEKT